MEPVREAYGALADRYIELFGHVDQVHADDLDLIARHLAIRPGAVLDVGCRPGHLTTYLRSLDVEATGIDIVPKFLRHARCTGLPLAGRRVLGSPAARWLPGDRAPAATRSGRSRPSPTRLHRSGRHLRGHLSSTGPVPRGAQAGAFVPYLR